MISNKISILHTGDIQIEVRNQHQRYDDFTFLFNQLELQLETRKPTIYLIAGDIFENWNANDIERKLFIDHLHKVLEFPYIEEIIIQDGNHDINQRKDSNFFKSDGKDELTKNSLETIISAIDNSKIIYLDESKIYESVNIPGLVYFNWAQKTKHSFLRDELYNPLLNYNKEVIDKYLATKTCVTIYHDPISAAINFDGKLLRGADSQPTLSETFITKTVLAGDIHMPQVHEFNNNNKFIYCSSPIQRNFGEGDYYEDGVLYQKGVLNHKIHYCILNPDGSLEHSEYVTIPQFNSYNTFKISNKVTDPEHIPWEVINTGEKITTIRISFPSASEKYLSWETQIIELIKKQNLTINLHFTQSTFGKGISLEEDEGETQTLDEISELLEIDKVIEISKTYIANIVNRTSTILPEDKERSIKYIEEMFTSELQNFNREIETNNIWLENCTASNFMSFGDNVKVQLNNPGLTKLTGGNGVGKTTLYNFLSWMPTGFISTSQNQNHKNANNLLVFNDYRWNIDIVNGELGFYFNGVPFHLERIVERTWKRNVTDEQKQSKEWRKYIANTSEKINLTNIDTNQTITDSVAEEMLLKIFKGIHNLRRLVFVNDSTLEQMVKTDTATLADEILNNIGFNFFDLMLSRYDELRSEKMSTLSKSNISVDVMRQDLIESEKLQKTINDESEIIKLNLETKKTKISELEKVRDLLQSQKHQVTSIDVKNLEDKLAEDKALYKFNKGYLEQKLRDMETVKKSLRTLTETRTSISNNNAIKDKLTAEYNNINTEKYSLNNTITYKKTQLVELYKSVEEEYLRDINNLRTNIESINNKINLIASNKSNIETEFKLFVAQERQKLYDTYTNESTDLYKSQTHQTQLSNHNIKLNSDLNQLIITPDKCDKCDAPLSEEKINKKKQEIESLRIELDNTEIKINEVAETVIAQEKLCNKINTLLAELDAGNYINHKIINTKLQENTKLIKNYDLEIQKHNDEKITIQSKIDTDEPIIKESVRVDVRITNATNEIQELLKTVSELEINLQSKIKEVEEIDILIKLDTDEFERYNILNESIKNTETELKIHESKEELFEVRFFNITEKKEQLLENEKLNIDIIKYDSDIANENINKQQIEETISKMKVEFAGIENKISQLKTNIESAIEYRIAESAFKQYKTLLGKKGLPLYIFSLIKPILNSKLNNLLEDMDFRLYFKEDNSLQMMDLSKPGSPMRSPFTISGMQTVFCGLSLLYINRNSNMNFRMKELFIDEVSGKLNNGSDLEYKSMNYQEQLKKLLRKFEDMNIMIIDHVIDDMEEDIKLQVIPTNNGAYISKIDI